MPGTDPLEKFADRMEARAKSVERKVQALVVEAFNLIATQIFLYNPVWSGQSVVNWTASIGMSPKVRRVNVDRSNVGIANNKVTGSGGEGNKSNITPHHAEAAMAAITAGQTALAVAQQYKASKSGVNPAIWLSNSISYTPKLWTGGWPSNAGRTLASVIEAADPAINRVRSKILKF